MKIVDGEVGQRSKEGLLRLGEWSRKAVLRDAMQNKRPVIVANQKQVANNKLHIMKYDACACFRELFNRQYLF